MKFNQKKFNPKKLEKRFNLTFRKKTTKFQVGSVLEITGRFPKDRKGYLFISDYQNNLYQCIFNLPNEKKVYLFQTPSIKYYEFLNTSFLNVKFKVTNIDLKKRKPKDYQGFFECLNQVSNKQKIMDVEKNLWEIKDSVLTVLFNLLLYGKKKFIENYGKLIKDADSLYYSGLGKESPLKDSQWDTFFDALEFVDKKNESKALKTGKEYVEHDTRDKILIPYQTGSVTKIKPGTGELKRWLKTTKQAKHFIVSKKMDGTNGLLIYDDGVLVQAFTKSRKGTTGRPITAKVKQIPNIPKRIKHDGRLAINVEIQMSENLFSKKYKDRRFKAGKLVQDHENGYSTSRNFVSGVLTMVDTRPDILQDCISTAFTVVDPKNMGKEDQLKLLKRLGFNVVSYSLTGIDNLTESNLTKALIKAKANSDFSMDGLVVEVEDSDIRIKMEEESDNSTLNPSFSRAFKIQLEEDEVKVNVEKVVWEVSKTGALKPRVKITPVNLQGVTVTYATGFNASYIKENKIGTGTILNITRSGDVIPHILEVVKPTKADLPERCPRSDDILHWKEGVDLFCPALDCPGRTAKSITFFLKNLKVDFIGPGILERIKDYGFDSIDKILRMSVEDFLQIDGIKIKLANKIHKSIHDTLTKGSDGKGISLPELLHSSGIFGDSLGSTKFKWLWEKYSGLSMLDWQGYSKEDIESELLSIKGFGPVGAKNFALNIHRFNTWFKNNNSYFVIAPYLKIKTVNSRIKGQNIVFTGFRQVEWVKAIEKGGGIYQNGVNKKTDIVVTKDPTANTDKLKKAREFGAKIFSLPDFEKLLKIDNLV